MESDTRGVDWLPAVLAGGELKVNRYNWEMHWVSALKILFDYIQPFFKRYDFQSMKVQY